MPSSERGAPPPLLAHARSAPRPPVLQGLADTFLLLGLPFDSDAAKLLNQQIFETIYYASLRTSMQLAKVEGE